MGDINFFDYWHSIFTFITIGIVIVYIVMEKVKLKKSEEKNRKTNEFFNRIIEQSPYSTWISDDKGFLIRMNQACRNLLKITDTDVVGKYCVLEDNIVKSQGFMPLVESVYKQGKSVTFQLTYNSANLETLELENTTFCILEVSIFPIIDRNGKITNAVIQHNDITAVKQAEASIKKNNEELEIKIKERSENLYASEQKYRVLFESSIDALSIIDPETGKFIDCNEAAVKLHDTGTKENFIGTTPDKLSPEYQPSGDLSSKLAFEHIKKAFAEGKDTFEWIHCKSDGTPFSALVSLCTIIIKEKTHILGIGKDFTEQKRVEQQLIEAKEEAEKTNKIKSEFLANMSHEIRTPMNAIIGFTDIILETDLNKKQFEYLKNIKQSSNILLGVLNDILDFSKIEADKLKLENTVFDLNEILDKIKNIIDISVKEKKIETIFKILNIPQNLPYHLLGDSLRLSQILINLINNAIKFTERGKIIIIINLLEKNEDKVKIEFMIIDTGIGMTEEQQLNLFQPFSQADGSTTRKYGGTGLGLSICKRLVQMMGGDISVKSIFGKGSTFSFTLSFDINKDENYYYKPIFSTVEGSLSGSNILLVEDNNFNKMIAIEILEKAGAKVDIASNGKEAVKKISQSNYDAVLMDIQMPEMDGWMATQIIRDVLKIEIPIIAMTAHAFENEKKRCVDVGMNDYISKPIKAENVINILSKWLKKITPVEEKQDSSDSIIIPFSIPGANLYKAYRHLGDDMHLLNKVIFSFHSNFSDIGTQIAKELENGDLDAAYRTVHTLKGASGGLYHNRIKDICIALELSIGEKNMTKSFEFLKHLENELFIVMEAIKAINNNNTIPISYSQIDDDKSEMDIEEISSYLERLNNNLKKNKAIARNQFDNIKYRIMQLGFKKEVDFMEKHIAKLQFKAAQEILSVIISSINANVR